VSGGALPFFRERLADVLRGRPGLPHRLHDEGRHLQVEFPKQGPSGFDVFLTVTDGDVLLETDRGWHLQQEGPSEQQIEEFLGLVRDMLSTACRLRERRAGGRPYRWHLESFVEGVWRRDGTTGLVFWNYFGRRSEHVYQNDTLPARILHD
jgi:hypothetical protein